MLLLLISVCSFLYLLVLAWLWASDMMRSTASIKKSSRKQPDPPPLPLSPPWGFRWGRIRSSVWCGGSKNVFIPHAKKNTWIISGIFLIKSRSDSFRFPTCPVCRLSSTYLWNLFLHLTYLVPPAFYIDFSREGIGDVSYDSLASARQAWLPLT